MDSIKQLKRLIYLVCLERANQMHLHTRELSPKIRPLPSRFLHTVFTKQAMPLLQHFSDPFVRLDLGHSNQFDRTCHPIGLTLGRRNTLLNI